MKLFRAASVGLVPGSGVHSQMEFASSARKVTAPTGNRAKINAGEFLYLRRNFSAQSVESCNLGLRRAGGQAGESGWGFARRR